MPVFRATESEFTFPRLVVMADPGAGKTVFLGLLHEMTTKYSDTNGVFLADFDRNHQVLKGLGLDVWVDVYYDEDPNKPTAWKRFSDDSERIYVNKNPDKYSFIAGDSFTTMQNALFNDILHAVGTRVVKNRIMYRNVAMTDMSDYGFFERTVTNDLFPEFIKVCSLMGVVLTVHTEYVPGEAGQPPRIMPKIKGKALAGNTIMLYFNEAIMIKVLGTGSNIQRKVQTTKDSLVDLKSTTPGMPWECSIEEYLLRIGVHYGYLKGENIKKYAVDKKIDITKLTNFKYSLT